MRTSFNAAFEIVVGLEGKLSSDPHDPGNYFPDGSPGYTVWGLSTKYNKNISKDMTLEQAKDKYLCSYWIPAGCDDVPFPMDICLFDGQVNPMRGGNKELFALNPENWQEFLWLRAERYRKYSDPKYVKGHMFRCAKLFRKIKELK